MLILATIVVRRQIRFPAHTVVQGQPRMHFPGVLRVQRVVKLPRIKTIDRALIERSGKAHHKVAQKQARLRSIKCRRADGVGAGEVVQPLLKGRSPESELVRSFDPTDIFMH